VGGLWVWPAGLAQKPGLSRLGLLGYGPLRPYPKVESFFLDSPLKEAMNHAIAKFIHRFCVHFQNIKINLNYSKD
jgi:hypothetical protein